MSANGTHEYTSVPPSGDLESNSNSKKYTINKSTKGKVVISKLVCFFLVMGAILLAAVAALAVFLFVPGCIEAAPEALTSRTMVADIKLEATKKDDKDFRLPKTLIPLHYDLKIMPFLADDNFTTHGSLTIKMRALETTNKIVININDIEIDEHSVRVKDVKDESYLRIAEQGINTEKQIFTFVLERKMVKDEEYKLEFIFVSQLNNLMQGFYRSSYVDSSTNQERWMGSTQFSPTDARRAFPCFDEPAFKATFSISVGRPANMTSLSNMPKKSTTKSNEMEGWFWDHYEQTPQMSTYLVAFIVSDLQPYEFNTDGRMFTIWTRKDAINQAVYSSTIAPKVLKYFENYFNIKYPLPKVDMVAVPDFGFNAMENWGLITFRETALLLDPKVTTIKEKSDMALTMGHELAHQWFGNLATPRWWDDLWLKEGFATYFEYSGINHVEPTWNITDEFLHSEINAAFKIDSFTSSRPISFDVNSSNQIRQAFDKISYSKGASIIRMMRDFLGEEAFKSGLIHYLNHHQYSNANHDDLWASLTEKAHALEALDKDLNVKDIMDTWVKQPGFPVITAIADYKENKVKIYQKRFLISGKDSNKLLWWVPISYTTESQQDFEDTKAKIWLRNENETTFNLDVRNWWLINIKHSGYYIVNYDEANWKKLTNNLMSFPTTIRGQLLSNAMDLAAANELDYDIPLKLVLHVGRYDGQLVPYSIAFDKLKYLYDMLVSTEVFGKFDVFILAAFHNAFDNTGFNENPSDSYQTQRLRQLILGWACKRTDSRCVIQSRHLYRAWMTTLQPVSPNVRKIVYCTAIREGGESEWNFAYNQYQKTTIASEKITILEALGCSSKQWILSRYLNFIITPNSGVRKQDGATVFGSVASNIIGNSLAFDFLRTNWKEINDYYGVAFSRVSKMVESLPLYMNTPYHLSQVEAFVSKNDLGTTKQAFDNIIGSIKNNIEWMSRSYPSVEKWLNDHSEHFGI